MTRRHVPQVLVLQYNARRLGRGTIPCFTSTLDNDRLTASSQSLVSPTPTAAIHKTHTHTRQQCSDSSEPDTSQQWCREVGTSALFFYSSWRISFLDTIEEWFDYVNNSALANSHAKKGLLLSYPTQQDSLLQPPWRFISIIIKSHHCERGESTAHVQKLCLYNLF